MRVFGPLSRSLQPIGHNQSMSKTLQFAHPATLEPDGKFYVVTFPDIPEAITQGKGLKDALAMAKDVLECAMEFYLESHRPIPVPSKARPGQHIIEIEINLPDLP